MGRDSAALSSIGRALGRALVVVVPAGFIGIFFLYPLFTVLTEGLDSAENSFTGVITDSAVLRVAWFSTWQAVVSTLLTVAVALPIAGVMARYSFRYKALVRAVLTVPFVLPTVVVAAALLSLMDRSGLDGGTLRLRHTVWVILIAHVYFNFAVVVRSVSTYWGHLDPAAEQAARMLGAGRVRTFVEVTLPRIAPSVWAAAAIVFLFSFTSFGVVLILGGPRRATLDTEIWRYATQRIEFDVAATLAVLQLGVVVLMLVLNSVLRRRRSVGERLGSHRSLTRRAQTGGERLWVGGVLAASLFFIVTPLALLVERSLSTGDGYSLDNYRALGDSGGRIQALFVSPWEAVWNSLMIASVATLIAGSIGLLAALVVVHGRRGVSTVFDVVFLVPLGTSAVTLGFGFLIALDDPPLDLRSSWILLPIAHALVGIPFVIRSITPLLRAIDPRQRDAASIGGAGPARVRWEVDAPVAWRGLLIGAGFAFAVSLGEFGATAFIARPDNPTVPVAIFRLLARPGEAAFGQAMALSVILMLMVGAAVLLIERLRIGSFSEF